MGSRFLCAAFFFRPLTCAHPI